MEPNDRRGEILDSAEAVFLLRGLRAATVDEITSRAGIAKGTFYLYFDSKDAAREAICERFGAELLRDVVAALKRKNRAQAVGAFIAAVVDFKVRNRAATALISHPSEGSPPAESEQAIGAAFARFLADGARAGDFDVKDPQTLATLLYGSLRASFEEPGAAADPNRIRDAAQELFRAVLLRKRRKK